jgi:dTDP-4-amino-4,6-dideoxygalactose transaminase
VQKKLQELQVGSMVYYPVPLHKLPLYADMPCTLPESEKAAGEVISLPIWPKIDADTQKQVVDAVKIAVS